MLEADEIEFRSVWRKRITHDRISHYFTRTDLFEAVREYYNEDAYRFEIPAEEFDTIREELAGEYVDLVVAEDRESYCVVIEQYTEYGDILRDSVAHWER